MKTPFVFGMSVYFARNSEGVRPVSFLKIRLKWCVYPKPSRWAVSLILCPCIRRLLPLSITKEWIADGCTTCYLVDHVAQIAGRIRQF